MQHHHCAKAIDKMFEDIYGTKKLFGRIIIVFGRDFWQIFSVVVKISREEIVVASLQQSNIWSYIKVCKLTNNMHLKDVSNKK